MKTLYSPKTNILLDEFIKIKESTVWSDQILYKILDRILPLIIPKTSMALIILMVEANLSSWFSLIAFTEHIREVYVYSLLSKNKLQKFTLTKTHIIYLDRYKHLKASYYSYQIPDYVHEPYRIHDLFKKTQIPKLQLTKEQTLLHELCLYQTKHYKAELARKRKLHATKTTKRWFHYPSLALKHLYLLPISKVRPCPSKKHNSFYVILNLVLTSFILLYMLFISYNEEIIIISSLFLVFIYLYSKLSSLLSSFFTHLIYTFLSFNLQKLFYLYFFLIFLYGKETFFHCFLTFIKYFLLYFSFSLDFFIYCYTFKFILDLKYTFISLLFSIL